MLCLILIVGGLLIMMGQHDRSEALFYYFRLEDQVPENHLLRLIEKHISFAFVREKLKASYSETGRPSIDPELLLRILLIGYLYGITSERKLVEELRMHLAWRWFTGLGFDQEIPHHSTFSKNRHGRFQESKLFEQLFEQIVKQCVEVGLVQGKHLSVDGSLVEANAAKESRIPREQLAEAAQVNQTVRQYLVELEQQNPTEEPVHQQDQVSTTDPDATYATKGGIPARMGYYDNYLIDNDSCVIVGVQATAARMSQETVAAQNMLTRFTQWQGREPKSVAADTTYGNGEFLQWLADRNITPYMRTRDSIHRKRSPFFGPERFTYEPEHNRYICPAGQALNYGGRVYRNRAFNYIGTRKKCGPCSLRPQCTSAAFRGLIIHQNEPARQRARELVNTPAFASAQRQRKKVEALFAELKNQIGLRRLRLRRLKFVREQFFLAAAAQNLKRLVRFLSQPITPSVEATAWKLGVQSDPRLPRQARSESVWWALSRQRRHSLRYDIQLQQRLLRCGLPDHAVVGFSGCLGLECEWPEIKLRLINCRNIAVTLIEDLELGPVFVSYFPLAFSTPSHRTVMRTMASLDETDYRYSRSQNLTLEKIQEKRKRSWTSN